MGKKKYTEKTLRSAVKKYFASITRTRVLTEPEDTGELDKYGHPIFRKVPVLNSLGEEVKVEEYVVPPDEGGLCKALGIHRSTWINYHDRETYPEFQEIVEEADDRLRGWNEREMLVRSGKDVKGILFNLENNYGYREKRSVELGGEGIESYLQRLQERGEEQAF